MNLVSDYPYEWKLIVNKYYTPLDDAAIAVPAARSVPKPAASAFSSLLPVSAAHESQMCDALAFKSLKALNQHARIKHGKTSAIARSLPDITICPVCLSNFHERSRLVSHLSETRTRSATRGTNCHFEFLKIPGAVLPEGTIPSAELRGRQKEAFASARKKGHTHVIAEKAATKGRDSVLKGMVSKPYHLRRRIPTKTSLATLLALYPSAKNVRIAPLNPQLRPSFFSFGRDGSSIGISACVVPTTTFSSPLKKRRFSYKQSSIVDQVSVL